MIMILYLSASFSLTIIIKEELTTPVPKTQQHDLTIQNIVTSQLLSKNLKDADA